MDVGEKQPAARREARDISQYRSYRFGRKVVGYPLPQEYRFDRVLETCLPQCATQALAIEIDRHIVEIVGEFTEPPFELGVLPVEGQRMIHLIHISAVQDWQSIGTTIETRTEDDNLTDLIPDRLGEKIVNQAGACYGR